MRQSEFDKFAEEYRALHTANIRLSGENPDFFAAYKVRDVYQALLKQGGPITGLTILDFGGGIGTSIPYFRKYFPDANLVCLDVSRRSLEIARQKFYGMAQLLLFDGVTVPLCKESIDLIFAACAFHHIDQSAHIPLITQFYRILKDGGRFFVFEHNPFNPLTLHAVKTCPFDENACLINGSSMREKLTSTGFARVHLRYRIFFPRILAMLRPLEKYLTGIPFGAQYYVLGHKS